MANEKKRALGRGLESLLGDAINDRKPALETDGQIASVSNIQNISIKSIETNPFQPRTEFDKNALLELSLSIKELGIIQPITVRKLGADKYQLISGERRLRASQAAGLTEIPTYIRVANDQAMLEMALVENIQRRDLNPIEVALSYDRLVKECDLTQEELGNRVGKNRASTSNYLRLLKLPSEIQSALSKKEISFGHGRALAALDDEQIQLYIFDQIKKESWSVRKLEQEIRESKEVKTGSVKKKKISLSFSHQKIKDNLIDLLQTKVDLKSNNKGGGQVVIKFKSGEELDRLMGILNA
ncbi:MAG: ParB family chromosome partitioning protein [Glaciecola sp.]|jgi:ParB family chromosome partitioning protein